MKKHTQLTTILVATFALLLMVALISYYIWYRQGIKIAEDTKLDTVAVRYLEKNYNNFLCASKIFAKDINHAYAGIFCSFNRAIDPSNDEAFINIATFTISNGAITSMYQPDEIDYSHGIKNKIPSIVVDEYGHRYDSIMNSLMNSVSQRQPK